MRTINRQYVHAAMNQSAAAAAHIPEPVQSLPEHFPQRLTGSGHGEKGNSDTSPVLIFGPSIGVETPLTVPGPE